MTLTLQPVVSSHTDVIREISASPAARRVLAVYPDAHQGELTGAIYVGHGENQKRLADSWEHAAKLIAGPFEKLVIAEQERVIERQQEQIIDLIRMNNRLKKELGL